MSTKLWVPHVLPFWGLGLFWGYEGSPTKIESAQKQWYPFSSFLAEGPRHQFLPPRSTDINASNFGAFLARSPLRRDVSFGPEGGGCSIGGSGGLDWRGHDP